MFSDCGWEYFNSPAGRLCFRKPASEIQSENDGEIFSDTAAKTDMIRHIMKTRMFPICIISLCCVLPSFLLLAGGNSGRAGLISGICLTALFLLYIYLILRCTLKLRRLNMKYERK